MKISKKIVRESERIFSEACIFSHTKKVFLKFKFANQPQSAYKPLYNCIPNSKH